MNKKQRNNSRTLSVLALLSALTVFFMIYSIWTTTAKPARPQYYAMELLVHLGPDHHHVIRVVSDTAIAGKIKEEFPVGMTDSLVWEMKKEDRRYKKESIGVVVSNGAYWRNALGEEKPF